MRMTRLGAIAVAALTLPMLLTLTASPARAEVYPWCAIYSGGDMGGATNCGFSTIQQCQATVSGIGGFCQPNPLYHPEREPPRDRRHRRDRD